MVEEKLVKRGVSLKGLEYGKVEEATQNTVRQTVTIQVGISSDKAREINKLIKEKAPKGLAVRPRATRCASTARSATICRPSSPCSRTPISAFPCSSTTSATERGVAARDMPEAEVDVSVELVRGLLTEQHPDLAGLPLEVVANGWDNVVIRLGADLCVRAPRRVPPPSWC